MSILFFMEGRIFGVKKINILRASCIVNFSFFVTSIFLSIFVLKVPKYWFDFFMIFVGMYLLTKSYLYKMDSNCYLGFLLLFLGALLFTNTYFNLDYVFIAIVLSFAVASILTYLFFKQKFHLVYGINFLFWCLDYYLFRQNYLNIYIFFVLIAIFIFIFSLIYAKMKIEKK